jgi:transposase-like protein
LFNEPAAPPSTAQPYDDLICADDPHFALRHQLVRFVQTDGLKAAARPLGCSRNTARKWFRRFQDQGNAGLRSQSRAPLSCPHKTKIALENRLVALRQKSPRLWRPPSPRGI